MFGTKSVQIGPKTTVYDDLKKGGCKCGEFFKGMELAPVYTNGSRPSCFITCWYFSLNNIGKG